MKNQKISQFTTDTLHKDMVQKYADASTAKHIILGYTNGDNIMILKCKVTDLIYYTKLDRSSYKNAVSLRFYPTKAIKDLMLAHGAVKIATVEQFKTFSKTVNTHNKGDAFEAFIHSLSNIEWRKRDFTAFYQAPDIVINGVGYELKFERGTITTEHQLKRIQEKEMRQAVLDELKVKRTLK